MNSFVQAALALFSGFIWLANSGPEAAAPFFAAAFVIIGLRHD